MFVLLHLISLLSLPLLSPCIATASIFVTESAYAVFLSLSLTSPLSRAFYLTPFILISLSDSILVCENQDKNTVTLPANCLHIHVCFVCGGGCVLHCIVSVPYLRSAECKYLKKAPGAVLVESLQTPTSQLPTLSIGDKMESPV